MHGNLIFVIGLRICYTKSSILYSDHCFIRQNHPRTCSAVSLLIAPRVLELQYIWSTYCVAGPGEARNVLAFLEPGVSWGGGQDMRHTSLVGVIT